MKVRSCLINLVFYDKVTCIVDEGKAGGAVDLDFNEAFDTIAHTILLEKLSVHDRRDHKKHETITK